ncbi:GNAT family N-acetyltransferase [Streptomyces cacaoi]|uniref:GNAT family N-acetyltransferase n=1 Tax=Streptomyces cacaoi TaxID=1898 RepID=UPI003325DAFD
MATTMPVSVRPMTVDDCDLYRELRLNALADAPRAFGSTYAREAAFTAEQWRERLAARSTLLAEADGKPCGLAAVIPEGPGRSELVSMWVAPDARGRGIGGHLVRAALELADARGVPEVRLWVVECNPAAERLYTRHGFAFTGEVQPVREGEPTREYAMLRPAPATGTGTGTEER